jgi:isopentenyldiphosphate isomerase
VQVPVTAETTPAEAVEMGDAVTMGDPQRVPQTPPVTIGPPPPAQDEGELFDLYTREGAPLGVRKPRAAVHRDGDWHRSVHIWVWGAVSGAPHVVFQRRSAGKDTWPGALDVAVTGHARAGEPLEATLREAEEEIGLPVRLADIVRLGLRRRADRRGRPGAADNELQDIFARVGPAPIADLTPCPAELDAILAIPLADAAAVLDGGGEARGLRLVRESGEARFVPETVHGGDFVPAPDGYYARAIASLEVVIAGETPSAWEIG